MSNLNPTVFIVGADPSVRASAEAAILRTGWSVRKCANSSEFLALPRPSGPHCVVLAIELAADDAVHPVQCLAAERRESSIIVIGRQGDVPGTVRLMKAGANEVLMQPVADETLLAAIGSGLARSHQILREESYLLELRCRQASLSARERQVMLRVTSGMLNKQVGGSLGISVITVKVHRRHAMQKMGAASLAHLVGMAILLFPDQVVLSQRNGPAEWMTQTSPRVARRARPLAMEPIPVSA